MSLDMSPVSSQVFSSSRVIRYMTESVGAKTKEDGVLSRFFASVILLHSNTTLHLHIKTLCGAASCFGLCLFSHV